MTNTLSQLDWLPDYTIRYSKRARYLQLRIHPKRGLEVVLPEKRSSRLIKQFLQDNIAWLHKHQHTILATHARLNMPVERPTEISLIALGLHYPITYQNNMFTKRLRIAVYEEKLHIEGQTDDPTHCIQALRHWLRDQAQRHFSIQLQQISQQYNLPYGKLCIRSPQRCWGSCSQEHDIMLNDKLLFLPTALVRYVMIHELCHTRYFDHSAEFWNLVKTCDPNYQQHRQALFAADQHLPGWLN